jgi:colanic acid/amylovoran biosynthesis glycosyltransferase
VKQDLTPRVVFVLSKFPCYDEAFLLREIHAVSRYVDTWVFSLRRSTEAVVHDEASALLPRVLCPTLAQVLRAQVSMLRQRPRRYLAALASLVSGNFRSAEVLLKNLVFFPRAVCLAQWALENRVTHLHAGWATYPASAALVAAEISGLPFSFSGHAHDIYLDTTHLPEKLERAAFVTTCTESNLDHLRRLAPDCPEQRIVLAHHGIRLDAFAPAARAEAPLSILSVGTLNPHKGFEYLIDAFALLAEDGIDFRATIVGGGPLEDALRARLQTAGLEQRVVMTGALTQAELMPYFARASIFVLAAQPEWHWGIPNVIVEALAARSAVVTTRFGSVQELVKDGQTGLLVPAKDPVALAATLRRLAGDPALRLRLAEAGHAVVAREFQLDRCVETYVGRFQGGVA